MQTEKQAEMCIGGLKVMNAIVRGLPLSTELAEDGYSLWRRSVRECVWLSRSSRQPKGSLNVAQLN